MSSLGESFRSIYRKISTDPLANAPTAEGLTVKPPEEVPVTHLRKIRRGPTPPIERFRIAMGGCRNPNSEYNQLAADPKAFEETFQEWKKGPIR